MAFIPAPDTAELSMHYLVAGEDIVNVSNFLSDEPWDLTTLSQLANAAIDAADELLMATMTGNVTLVKAVATSLETDTSPQQTVFAPGGVVGTGGSAYLPLNQALVLKFGTSLRGRSYRGRLYHYGMIRDAQTDADTWVAASAQAVLDAYVAWYEAVEGEITGHEVSHAVVSRREDNAPRTTAVVTPISTYSYNPAIGTMRRRIGG